MVNHRPLGVQCQPCFSCCRPDIYISSMLSKHTLVFMLFSLLHRISLSPLCPVVSTFMKCTMVVYSFSTSFFHVACVPSFFLNTTLDCSPALSPSLQWKFQGTPGRNYLLPSSDPMALCLNPSQDSCNHRRTPNHTLRPFPRLPSSFALFIRT